MGTQFSARVLVCIRSALEKYGAAVAQILIWNFEKETKLSAADIAKKPDEFVNCIYRIFGPSASAIEKGIADEICREFNLEPAGVTGMSKAIELARTKLFKEELTD